MWLVIAGFGLWREHTVAAADLSQRLRWAAETASETVRSVFDEETRKWAWAEVIISPDGDVKGVAWFDPAPLPAAESPEFLLFQQGMLEEVLDRNPGALSPAGIPLGPMAAYKLLLEAHDDGVARQRAQTVRELCFAFPSAITPQLLEQTDVEMSRRGLHDVDSPSWRDRWNRVLQVSRAVDAWMKNPVREQGARVGFLDGEWWRTSVRVERGILVLGLAPMADALLEIESKWRAMPPGGGSQLALTSLDGALLTGSNKAEVWPYESVRLNEHGVDILALGDPVAARKAAWVRIMILGGACLLATAMLLLAWRKQQDLLRFQMKLVSQKDDFLSIVSHELRTPVASIQLLAENLATGAVRDPDDIDEYHKRLLQESRRLVSTTEQLLDFALMERGFRNHRFTPLDCAALADEIRRMLTPVAAAKGISLVVGGDAMEPAPYADFDSIRRVILNLGDNAIKFSPPSGRVEITIGSGPAGKWMIQVKDQGAGIAPADRSRIFDRFYRGGNHLQRNTRGTGIGLALVKRIVESHEGTVELTDTSQAGSIFTCILPLRPAQSDPAHEIAADRG